MVAVCAAGSVDIFLSLFFVCLRFPEGIGLGLGASCLVTPER